MQAALDGWSYTSECVKTGWQWWAVSKWRQWHTDWSDCLPMLPVHVLAAELARFTHSSWWCRCLVLYTVSPSVAWWCCSSLGIVLARWGSQVQILPVAFSGSNCRQVVTHVSLSTNTVYWYQSGSGCVPVTIGIILALREILSFFPPTESMT